MRVNQRLVNEVKERMLAMCTHDCSAFLTFRATLEGEFDNPALVAALDKLMLDMNNLLTACGAGTNEDYAQ